MDAPLILSLFGVVGLFVGSLVNLISSRLPLIIYAQWRQSCYLFITTDTDYNRAKPEVDKPAEVAFFSRRGCQHCQHSQSIFSILPLLPWLYSWLYVQGRCPHCKHAISPCNSYIELLTGFIFMVIVSFRPEPINILVILSLTALLLTAIIIDIRHQLLPDALTYTLIWSGLICGYLELSALTVSESLLGLIAGFLLLWLPARCFKLIKGVDGLGHGDIKLMAGLGAWIDASLLPAVLFFASLSGLIYWWFKHHRSADSRRPIAFGPFLAGAGWLALLGDPFIIDLSLLLQVFV